MDSSKGRFDDGTSIPFHDRNGSAAPGQGASSGDHDTNGTVEDVGYKKYRNRPRTYPYASYLPYKTEDEERRQHDLAEILKHLYIACEAGDFTPGAVHWTRELRSWLALKFDPTKEQRAKLVRLYYELALAPGIDPSVSERFASMFMILVKRKHYLGPLTDLVLDWRPLYREIKIFVLPVESGLIQTTSLKRNIKTLVKMCSFAQPFFEPETLPELLDEVLPYFSTSFIESAFVCVGLINLFLPTTPSPSGKEKLKPQYYLPTCYHLWSMLNRSRTCDVHMLDLFSRIARDSLSSLDVPFSEFGIFTQEQTSLIFTAILRLLEIPVGQATSPYSPMVDLSSGLGVMIERDSRKHPVAHHIARWIVMSLSPSCVDAEVSVLSLLEALIQAIETFYHPSNTGSWTKTLAQLAYYLSDFFVVRWNRERNGEMVVPPERRLNEAVRKRFVLCLRDVIFMGIYSKSTTAMNFALSTLQSLAYLEPELMLPGALQRIYPSMQGLVEVHRTTSSLRSLQVLARTMIRTKGYRCHITALLGLALPGIDANDLEKSFITLAFFTTVSYNIPFQDLSKGREDEVQGNMLAMQWITGEMEKMEQEGASVELNYQAMDAKDEELILASSTAGFSEFVSSFLGRVFTLLENLPDAARLRSASPEENIVNTLPAAFMPLLAALSPELYDVALNKIVDFVANHVIHQARDAMAFICNVLCKVNPGKALDKLIPVLISSIRTEIDENGAGSTRNAAADVLPRDRGLVWNVSMLSMCVVHVGEAVLKHRQELFDIALYMQKKCKGMPTVHISNFIHHLLLNLTVTYTNDYSLYEPEVVAKGISAANWGAYQDPKKLTVKWHVPNREELEFAVELFSAQAESALKQLQALTDGTSSIKREGSGKEWSDEVSRNLVLLRLLISGISVLFDSKGVSEGLETRAAGIDADTSMSQANGHAPEDSHEADHDATLDGTDETSIKPSFQYPTGYSLVPGDELYEKIHSLRQETGRVLHRVHRFLTDEQEDDVSCFGPLYTAYRAWFVDVGIERSAHLLDRVVRLLHSDEQPYKFSGVRKDYPRAILARRANVYNIQRLRHNAAPRARSELDELLLLDIAESSVSLYTEVRRNAQSAGESALKVIFGARLLVIPPLLEAFQKAVKSNDFPRIKGSMYTLLFGSLAKTVGRHWKYTPDVIRTFIEAGSADKQSIQKLISGGVFQIMDYGRPVERMAILNEEIVKSIAPAVSVADVIAKKKKFLIRKRTNIEKRKAELAEELIDLARTSQWKKATRTATIVLSLGLRFDFVASENMINLITMGTVDAHPSLRGMYSQTLMALFSMIDVRAVCSHEYSNYIQGKQYFPAKIHIEVNSGEEGWTDKFLSEFAKPDAEYYVDHDHPGWLVWGKSIPAYKSNVKHDIEYDELEWVARKSMGQLMDRAWFKTFFKYMKQEPRDSSADKFRMSISMVLLYCFELTLRDELTTATFDDIKEETLAVFEDGSDKHQHRATAEIMGGLISSVMDSNMDLRKKVWEFVFPIVRKILENGLTPENQPYWTTFLHMILQGRDPRRAWPLVDWLASFKLDIESDSAFREASKIHALHQCIVDAGWHFQLDKTITEDFVGNIDHPYKGVREAMAQTLASIFRTRHHESFRSVDELIEAQRNASSIGIAPYRPTREFAAMMKGIFSRIERWRHERVPNQQIQSSYTAGSKTTLLLLDSMLSSAECIQLLSFFPNLFTEELLHMMDVKDDGELASLAYHVFRHLPNIPHRLGEDTDFIDVLIRVGTTSPLWHQRLRVMINMQIVFFRRIFLLSPTNRQKLFDCVASMLEDTQHEVRSGAAATLSGMIRCSPAELRDQMVAQLRDRFTRMLDEHPLPKKPRPKSHTSGLSTSARSSTGTNTPTPEQQRLAIVRHAAVLGLGSLVQAFPYWSPPPAWMPQVLITLSGKAANDPGNVGASVKSIISEFKKTRQDTWHIDMKVCFSVVVRVGCKWMVVNDADLCLGI